PEAAENIWKRMSVHRFWQLVMGDAIGAYYAHPWAWDEIGFGGPAYPRAYTRLERGEPEPWEVEEQRYDWLAPTASVSDEVESTAQHHTEAEQNRHAPRRSR
ncbi:MAG: gluconate 2-dehydrogenase subunit 3 family protein, partial [Edaphobacter sp.]